MKVKEILNRFFHVYAINVAPIGKSTFNYLVGLCESHMAALVQGLLNHEFILWERSAKFKGDVDL
jgi:hypothetical protein